MEEPTIIECFGCGRKISLEKFLSECARYLEAVRVIQHICPQCDHPSEAQIEPGEISFGYVYSAGDLHFSVMKKIEVAGLSRLEQPTGVKVFLGDLEWSITNT